MLKKIIICTISILTSCFSQQEEISPWIPDNGDGTYTNPVIFADYSDPDVIRVGDDFYMTASSFNCVPGLPILHSNDLVNWSIIGHALPELVPHDVFNTPQHGKGVWAPSIRYHNGEFYIYYGDPDLGIYMVKSKRAEGPWEPPVLVQAAKGWIDPCPFWDDDGTAYLVHAFAKSRAGINSVLALHKMNPEGTTLLDSGKIIFDGHKNHPTIEGPKIYKRNGFYYIFAPAGGVKPGWQTVLRSKNIYGPYEDKIVMSQGNTPVNGPHQGAWVELPSGESWFLHFQDRDAYGRIVHLQPLTWKTDFPVIGDDKDGDGTGEPVMRGKKPNVGKQYPVITPQTSDEFTSDILGLQWQWQANPESSWYSLKTRPGYLRLFPQAASDSGMNLWQIPNLLLQKIPAPKFSATAKFEYTSQHEDVHAGIVVMGTDYASLSIERRNGKLSLLLEMCARADSGGTVRRTEPVTIDGNSVFLSVTVSDNAACRFAYSVDNRKFIEVGTPFSAKAGKWIGAKVGLFCIGENPGVDDFVDVDWVRIEKQ
jgi:beta-xylosidase